MGLNNYIEMEDTHGNALDPHSIRGAEELEPGSPFLELNFNSEDVVKRAEIVFECDPQVAKLIKRQIGISMDQDAINYYAVRVFPNDTAVWVMIGGLCQFSSMEEHTFDVSVFRKDKNGDWQLWGSNPFTHPYSEGRFYKCRDVDRVLRSAREYTADGEPQAA